MKIIKTLLVINLFSVILFSFNIYATDQSICDPNSNVVLFNNGALQSCQLKDNYDVNNITCKNGGIINFYENGALESCVLYAEVTLSDTKCKPDAPIYFFNNGNLRACMKQD
jgi:hypothetical protein